MANYTCTSCDYSYDLPGHIESNYERRMTYPCPACAATGTRRVTPTRVPAARSAVDQGWRFENGGRGRYISQLQRTPGRAGSDKGAFCTSQNEAIEKAKQRGFRVTKNPMA
jgi:hypothetical protein